MGPVWISRLATNGLWAEFVSCHRLLTHNIPSTTTRLLYATSPMLIYMTWVLILMWVIRRSWFVYRQEAGAPCSASGQRGRRRAARGDFKRRPTHQDCTLARPGGWLGSFLPTTDPQVYQCMWFTTILTLYAWLVKRRPLAKKLWLLAPMLINPCPCHSARAAAMATVRHKPEEHWERGREGDAFRHTALISTVVCNTSYCFSFMRRI